jgi:uncharacterized membrane protein
VASLICERLRMRGLELMERVDVLEMARKEFEEEEFREAVEKEKERLRNKKKSFWKRYFPFLYFKISIKVSKE